MTETAQDFSQLSSLTVPDTRPGVIVWRTFRDNLPSVVGWGLGYSVLIAVSTLLYPLLDESNTVFTVLNGLGLLDNLTQGRDLEMILGFPGYLALQAMSWGPLILSVYIIPQALGAVAAEEQQGTLDILLSTPISRWRFLIEKTLAIVLSLAGILVIVWLGMLLSTRLLVQIDLGIANMISSAWHLMPISLVILTGTLLLSVILHDARQAGGLAALLVLVNYFARSMSDVVTSDFLESIKQFSFFSSYRSVAALGEGFQWQNDFMLLALAASLFILSLIAFQRRDLGV